MTTPHGHRRPSSGIGRRTLLGIAGLGVPAAAIGAYQMRAAGAPEIVDPAPSAPSAAPSVTPSPFADADPDQKLGGTVPYRAGKAMRGSYLGLKGKTYAEALALRKKQLGRTERIVHVFYAWEDRLPTSIPYLPKSAVPLVSWRGAKYKNILNGKSDDLIAAAARRIRALDQPTLLRWGWEMNGHWYEWGGKKNGDDPDGYVECYRRLHRIFDEEGADNVSWVWSPNWNANPQEAWNATENYYPGDDYVDWVGVSGYNLHEESPQTLFDGIYQGFSARKPIMITEVGSMDWGGTTKADWITAFARYVQERPAIGAVVWFDTDTHESYTEDWRTDTDEASIAAYRALAQNARFAG
ncbi:glycoside hydrolase family 26 protein [Actinoplanes rectilineatus]|uniref:glycoside hydrolase family 26 protein n=1 Tax=Actinoplanes rectilineatus TaxID=113571 RepID=UPI000698E131|nr:glycosyl hydrolase [Actinoplanes rectilineatus]